MLTAGNTEIEVRIMWGLFRNGKQLETGNFWITCDFYIDFDRVRESAIHGSAGGRVSLLLL